MLMSPPYVDLGNQGSGRLKSSSLCEGQMQADGKERVLARGGESSRFIPSAVGAFARL